MRRNCISEQTPSIIFSTALLGRRTGLKDNIIMISELVLQGEFSLRLDILILEVPLCQKNIPLCASYAQL